MTSGKLCGILNVKKDAGMTSHDVVAIVRRIVRPAKVGHAGTLDPMATGVLPVCIGQATRVAEYLSERGKSYVCEMKFGAATDTLDSTGEIVRTAPVPALSEEALDLAMEAFRGDILQVPPMYSALKRDGKKLYELARQGIEVEREARPVHISELRVLSVGEDTARFFCRCSKGTYIRTLVDDIARAMGSAAYMTALERASVGPLTVENAVAIDELRVMSAEELSALLLPMETAVDDLPALELDARDARLAVNGVRIARPSFESLPVGRLLRLRSEGRFLGVAELRKTEEGNTLFLQKVLAER